MGRLLAGGHNGLGQLNGPVTAVGPMVAHGGRLGSGLHRRFLDQFNFSGRVILELIDRHYHRNAVHFGIANMRPQVGQPGFQQPQIFFGICFIQRPSGHHLRPAAVHL